ncbi:MAG: hypothetical protein JWO33_1305 [Caulobacteraceae bacterium]|nr:hypothetical protein [Caulobacteraceae bacterium]
MAARAIHFVSKRLQRATFAFLCLALAQLGLALASVQAETSPTVRVHIQQP